MEADRRLELVQHIVDVATGEYGIALADIVIDPLAMPIGADTENARTTFDTMQRIRAVHGLNMTCGASNVSFGMPDRHTLGAAFLPMAMTAGLTSAIMDTRTPQIVDSVKAADLLLGAGFRRNRRRERHHHAGHQHCSHPRAQSHGSVAASGTQGRQHRYSSPARPAKRPRLGAQT